MPDAVIFQLFAKAPVPGQVKTRLHPALGHDGAARLYQRLVAHAAAAVGEACQAIPGARGELWCSPDTADRFLQGIGDKYRLVLRQQAPGDLGERMRHALESAMPGRVLLLGSDCPPLDCAMLVDAHRALTAGRSVFIPADDGGYALVGCAGCVPDCFTEIAWSTSNVMDRTRMRLQTAGTQWIELASVWDVDTPADLVRLAKDARFSSLLDSCPRADATSLQHATMP